MKSLRVWVLSGLLVPAAVSGQNLVPNPSFEDTTYCGVFHPVITPALHWYNVNTATPDIWNCDTIDFCGVYVMDPNDPGIIMLGYSPAYDGERFAAGYHWFGPNSSNTREYLTVKLLTPLQAGVAYAAGLWCARPYGMNGAIDHIGVFFGPDSIHEPYPTTLPYTPQVQLRDPNSTYIQDTNWVQLVDTFVASGGEEWVVVGTFNDANDVDGIWLGFGNIAPRAYYYIDLLTVEPVIPQGGGTELVGEGSLALEGDWLVWRGEKALDELMVLDARGRSVYRAVISGAVGGRYGIPAQFPTGLYLAVARSGDSYQVVRFVR